MAPILFKFHNITLYTYGFFVALAVLVSYFFAGRRAKSMNLEPSMASDLVFYVFIFGVIGARLFYVAQHFEEYQNDLLKIIAIPEGGLVWYGGFIFAAIAGLAVAAWNKWPYLEGCDLLAPLVPLAHAIGRLGCFFNGCCYGRETRSWMGVVFPGDDIRRLPVQLFEAGALFLLSGGLFYLSRKKLPKGGLFMVYLMTYSVLRFLIEFLRGDQKVACYLTLPQWTSAFFFVGSFFLLLSMKKRSKARKL
ncbi:MAG: hypothetical protein AUJ72_03590 [Candidatus Omnitrophica bacterium CG1_02_46_14]|nr:MAG: hypothetical protein AUJ72_03590 [Candidatus Omnitrophica bacterium CG1_02_46_14]